MMLVLDREEIVKNIIETIRHRKDQEIQGIRGIGKTHLLKELREKLAFTGKFIPILLQLKPFFRIEKYVYCTVLSKVKEETDTKADVRSDLSRNLKKKGFIALPKAVKSNQNSTYSERLPKLLSALERDLGKIPVLLIDDVHYMQNNALFEREEMNNYPKIMTSVLPLNKELSLSMNTLTSSEIFTFLEKHFQNVEKSGAKMLKKLLGGIPSYLNVTIPILSDWTRRREMSLDGVLVKKVWRDEINDGVLSLIVKAYLQSYSSLLGEKAIECLFKVARGEQPETPHFRKLQQVRLINENSIVDKVLETWIQKRQECLNI